MITIIIICYNVFVKRNLKKIEKIFLYKNPAREETARRGFLRENTMAKNGILFFNEDFKDFTDDNRRLYTTDFHKRYLLIFFPYIIRADKTFCE